MRYLVIFKRSLLLFLRLDDDIVVVFCCFCGCFFPLRIYLSDTPEGFTHEMILKFALKYPASGGNRIDYVITAETD